MTVDVAVNLLWCSPGEVGGSEEYLVRQLAGLARARQRRRADAVLHDRRSPAPIRTWPTRFRSGRRVAWLDVGRVGSSPSTRGWRGSRRDSTSSTTAGGTTPLIGPRPILLTVHDLQYLEHPAVLLTVRGCATCGS